MIEFKFYKFFENLEFIYFADLPARSGIGSSSAYCCAVGNCIMNLKNIRFDKYKLAENSYQIERAAAIVELVRPIWEEGQIVSPVDLHAAAKALDNGKKNDQ